MHDDPGTVLCYLLIVSHVVECAGGGFVIATLSPVLFIDSPSLCQPGSDAPSLPQFVLLVLASMAGVQAGATGEPLLG